MPTISDRSSTDSRCAARRTAAVAALALALAPAAALAAGVVGSGTTASCTEAALDAALAGGGVVTFDCGAAPHTITVLAEKAIAADTEIDGGGLITLSGGGTTRILDVGDGIALTLRRITLSGGSVTTAPARGGALRCGGCDLAIYDSTFDGNHIDAHQTEGGAVWFGPATFGADSGSLLIARTTFSNNSATSAWSSGGALFVENTGATAYLVACTFAGNLAGGAWSGNGGAIHALGDEDVVLVNCTLSGNTSLLGQGGALYAGSGGLGVVLANTIVANSVGAANCAGSPVYVDAGNNLQFGGTVADSCGATIPTPAADPLGGGALADNGGYARTIALPLGSAAVDGGDAGVCGDPLPQGPAGGDERGWAHVGTCDIGAFELGARDPAFGGEPIPVVHPAGALLLALAIAAGAALALRRS